MPILALEHRPFPGDVQAYLTLNDLLYLSLQAGLGFLDLRSAQGLRFPDPPFERCLPLLGPNSIAQLKISINFSIECFCSVVGHPVVIG